MGGGMKAVLGEVMPCAGMVVVEGCIIELTIMASTALAKGMSPFVFVVYTNALASLILLPYTFFFDTNRSEETWLTRSFLQQVFFLGLIGVTIAQNLAFVGLSYSSPIVACGMANQIPALSFILAIILRTTKFDWKRSGSLARLIGTLISFGGAISLTLYKGPTIANNPPSLTAAPPRLLVFTSTHENWVLGCILFAVSSFTLAIWNILQATTIKICKQVMKIISFYTLFGTIQTVGVALYFERDPEAWKLDLNFELLVIVLTPDPDQSSNVVYTFERALFCALIQVLWNCLCHHFWLFALFRYFSLWKHYGSVYLYYTVLWGQIKDEEMSKSDGRNKIRSSSTDETKVPLLQQDSQV